MTHGRPTVMAGLGHVIHACLYGKDVDAGPAPAMTIESGASSIQSVGIIR
jgi:hypothetical protein